MKWIYLTIAIVLIIVLVAIFFVSYYLNKKTPIPKGCEDLLINKENCSSCKNYECDLKHVKENNEKEDK